MTTLRLPVRGIKRGRDYGRVNGAENATQIRRHGGPAKAPPQRRVKAVRKTARRHDPGAATGAPDGPLGELDPERAAAAGLAAHADATAVQLRGVPHDREPRPVPPRSRERALSTR